MTATERARPVGGARPARPGSIIGWLAGTDHKRIALLTLGTASVMMLVAGALATVIRAQLAQPGRWPAAATPRAPGWTCGWSGSPSSRWACC